MTGTRWRGTRPVLSPLNWDSSRNYGGGAKGTRTPNPALVTGSPNMSTTSGSRAANSSSGSGVSPYPGVSGIRNAIDARRGTVSQRIIERSQQELRDSRVLQTPLWNGRRPVHRIFLHYATLHGQHLLTRSPEDHESYRRPRRSLPSRRSTAGSRCSTQCQSIRSCSRRTRSPNPSSTSST
jgi:hypothetical protein